VAGELDDLLLFTLTEANMSSVRIGQRLVGDGEPVWIIGEVGINHNGDIETASLLIEVAKEAGCDAVKFQKRTVDVVYTKEDLDKPRESPYGTTNRHLKEHLELDRVDYQFIDGLCRDKEIAWLASCWDQASVDFIDQFDPPCYKIASASLTDTELLRYTASTGKPIILSTGMSRLEQIDTAVDAILSKGNGLILLHCVSTYPSENHQLNLRCMETLRDRYGVPIGYSGHEHGLATTVAAPRPAPSTQRRTDAAATAAAATCLFAPTCRTQTSCSRRSSAPALAVSPMDLRRRCGGA
jgi:N-acetylneuraminate synthase